jgi:branched-chain amino acid aminotransferase
MTERILYLNGAFAPHSEAKVSATDWGVFGGDGVYEVTRTFGRRPFRLEDHIDRLFRSLKYVRIDCGLSRDQILAASHEVIARNRPLFGTDEDFELFHVVTRGDPFAGPGTPATVVINCRDLAFARFAPGYLRGIRLMTPGVRRTPPQCIDPKAKVTSRMNQVQGMLEAREMGEDVVPLMLDLDGNIAETNMANFFFVSDGRLMTPAARNVLGGVTRATVCELATELGIEVREGNYSVHDVYSADEAFTSATSASIMPVASLNGVVIGNAEADLPGAMTLRLLHAFHDLVGLDFVAQALSHLGDNEAPGLLAEWQRRARA